MTTLSKNEIYKHYFRPEVRELIQRLSSNEGFHRCGNGDNSAWYHNGKFERATKDGSRYHIDLTTRAGYDYLVTQFRTLYWSLNFFDPEIFNIDFSVTHGPEISRQYTRAYMFGVDIDTIDHEAEHGTNIRTPHVKEAVEALGQYTSDRIREFAPNSVHCLFSGGGVYVLVHHEAFKRFFTEHKEGKEGLDFSYWLDVLIDAVNAFLGDIYNDFKSEYPKHSEYAKMDILNSAKRVFKAPYSIHKKHSYAVIPLDPEKVIIDFEDATIPLKDQVLERGKSWYSTFDADNRLLDHLEQHYFKRAEEIGTDRKYKIKDAELEISPIPIRDNWPPCIKNMLALPSCGEGATRALFFLATFLGQAGIPEEEAKDIFFGLARRWNKPTSNIFETKYRVLHCPNCETLRSPDNTGYPRGKSILHLGICKPDIRCIGLEKKNPRFYADKEAYMRYLKNRLKVIT
jgi:hypothetical protein